MSEVVLKKKTDQAVGRCGIYSSSMICASLRQKPVTFKQTFFGDRSLLLLVRVTLSIRRLSALFVYMALIIRIYGVGLTDVVIYIRSLALTTYRGYIYVYTYLGTTRTPF